MADLLELVVPASVRRLCRADMTTDDLSDDAARDEVYTLPAAAELLQLDPEAASREGDALKHVKAALNRLVAAQVLPTLSLVQQEDFGDAGGTKLQQLDVPKRVAELRAQARAEITFVLNAVRAGGSTTRIPTFFTTASTRRCR